ncbi:MAG: substrate-binding domain-containing protein, partial [Faecalibacterium sp.]|nr:substrate-binding domain-containing protein [Faecalibacterium sp.]MDY5504942.1 substrate-binding domain-containing protein [Faecalibacterium sp.]
MRIHKITRRNFMKVAGVSALAMGLAACGGSSSSTAASTSTAGSAAGGEVTGDKVVINIGHINDESDSWHQGALKFKEYCEANSNGTIEVD